MTHENDRPHDDYCWAMYTDEVRAVYGGRVVAVNQRKVWGVGADDMEALDDAQAKPGCPGLYLLTCASVPRNGASAGDEMLFWKPEAEAVQDKQPA